MNLSTREILDGRPHLGTLERLNDNFEKEKKKPVTLRAVPEDLGDEDLLEMVNAGLLPANVVYDWTAKLWNKLRPKLQLLRPCRSPQGSIEETTHAEPSAGAGPEIAEHPALAPRLRRARFEGTLGQPLSGAGDLKLKLFECPFEKDHAEVT